MATRAITNKAGQRQKLYSWGGGWHTTPAAPFTPFKPVTSPPAGTYDPSLDASAAAASRGLGDLKADTATQGARSLSDFLIAQGQLGHSHDQALGDIRRNYGNLATAQTERANAMGLAGSSGWDAGAAGVRAENQNREETLANYAFDQSMGAASTGYQRGSEDRANALDRAQRENQFYGQDVTAAKFYQAAGAGFSPPTAPSTERTRAGLVYQATPGGGGTLPSGKVLSHAALLAELRRRGYVPKTGGGSYGSVVGGVR